jgi:tRNA pseudouridine55 synthase
VSAKRERRRIDGVLLLDKPSGVTSNMALQRARRALRAEKAGHTGTLDPLASGLLPLCFGEATKFSRFLLDAGKRYRATVRLGIATDTLDAEGVVVASAPVATDASVIASALASMTGRQLQTPPAHAALKHQGRAYYDYARAGIDIPREPREIEIQRLDLVVWQPPDIVVDVACSKGTYVRVLAADLGVRLGSVAHLAALRRSASGGFSVDDAVALDALEAMPPSERHRRLLPVDVLVARLPRVELDGDQARAFLLGQALVLPPLPDPPAPHGAAMTATASAMAARPAVQTDAPATSIAVFGDGTLLGIGEFVDQKLCPRRVVASPSRAAATAI